MEPPADNRYLSVIEVIALHQAIMERMGAAPAPLRDEGALASAVMRPRMAAHYEQADLMRQAALLAAGIAQVQAFLDGNKRVALAAADVFLRLNGQALGGNPLELARQLEALATRSGSLEDATHAFEQWLRQHSTAL
jgi:death-on-curing protein